MPAQLLEGAPVAARLRQALEPAVADLKARGAAGRVAALVVADSPASRVYGRQQKQAFEAFAVAFEAHDIRPETTQADLLARVAALNRDPDVTGVTIHLPLPGGLDAREALLRLDPAKDIEGTHPANVGLLTLGPHEPSSCSARAALELLRSVRPSLRGLEVVILGKGAVVGKPLLLMLLEHRKDAATATVVHTGTRDLAAHTRAADVVFCAAGRAGLLRGDMVKPGAIVIDVSINEVPVTGPDGRPVTNAKGRPQMRLAGDAALDELMPVCSHVTPVPGGVGPVATVLLVRNWVACCARARAGRAV